jgi:hypothetical protein
MPPYSALCRRRRTRLLVGQQHTHPRPGAEEAPCSLLLMLLKTTDGGASNSSTWVGMQLRRACDGTARRAQTSCRKLRRADMERLVTSFPAPLVDRRSLLRSPWTRTITAVIRTASGILSSWFHRARTAHTNCCWNMILGPKKQRFVRKHWSFSHKHNEPLPGTTESSHSLE